MNIIPMPFLRAFRIRWCSGLCSVWILSMWMIATNSVAQDVVINEFMASNSHTILDEDGDASDWIEIYNTTTLPVNLGGMHLSDRHDVLDRWTFPDTILDAHSFLLVFASGKNRAITGSELHTNFSISSGGEDLYLSNQEQILQHIPAIELGVNQSFGFLIDGNGAMKKFITSSPEASNVLNHTMVELHVNLPGGIYSGSVSIFYWATDTTVDIRYTTDGSIPKIESFQFNQPLPIDQSLYSSANSHQIQVSPPGFYYPPADSEFPRTVVLRAAAFNADGMRVSEVLTNSYFTDDSAPNEIGLPVISLCADPDDLFDDELGIFVPGVHWDESDQDWSGNYNQRGFNWERPMHFEFYESEESEGIRQNGGLRTHGQASRRFPQKAMRLYARKQYGKDRFNYNLFPEKSPDSHKRLVLKPFQASWHDLGFEDYVAQHLANNLGLEHQGSRPVALYLNGEYWGIYFLLERIDKYFMEDNLGVNPDHVDMITGWDGNASLGNNEDFLDLYSFISENDLSEPHHYTAVTERIDVDNFIDYQLLEIFISNLDWPANNMRCWRHQSAQGKWRWLFYDGDAGFSECDFDGFNNALSTEDEYWPTNTMSTLFLRKLLVNNHFASRFFNRLEELLNSHFAYEATQSYHENTSQKMSQHIEEQSLRFGRPYSYHEWVARIEHYTHFLECRPCVMLHQVISTLGRNMKVSECPTFQQKPGDLWVRLFPNPNYGEFSIYYISDFSENIHIEIHDVSGRPLSSMVAEVNDGNNYISFNDNSLPAGMLFLTLTSSSGRSTVRFVKY